MYNDLLGPLSNSYMIFFQNLCWLEVFIMSALL